jgi:hypothetical protein
MFSCAPIMFCFGRRLARLSARALAIGLLLRLISPWA